MRKTLKINEIERVLGSISIEAKNLSEQERKLVQETAQLVLNGIADGLRKIIHAEKEQTRKAGKRLKRDQPVGKKKAGGKAKGRPARGSRKRPA